MTFNIRCHEEALYRCSNCITAITLHTTIGYTSLSITVSREYVRLLPSELADEPLSAVGSCLTEMGNACNYCMPGINNTESIEFFRILRVAFLRQASPTADSASATIYPFSYETITPQLITAATGSVHVERLETMRETFAKVMAFLCNSGMRIPFLQWQLHEIKVVADTL